MYEVVYMGAYLNVSIWAYIRTCTHADPLRSSILVLLQSGTYLGRVAEARRPG